MRNQVLSLLREARPVWPGGWGRGGPRAEKYHISVPEAARRTIAVAPERLPRLDLRSSSSTGGRSGFVAASQVHRQRLVVAYSTELGLAGLSERVLLRSLRAGERVLSKTGGGC